MIPSTRLFTIHFDGNVYETSVDCRATRTLRALLSTALPLPSPPPPPQSSLSLSSSSPMTLPLPTSLPPRGKQTAASWVDSYVCTFGGQRLPLAASTEVIPATLHVTLASQRRSANSGGVGTLKRRRPTNSLKRERNNDSDDDDDDYDDSSASGSGDSSNSGSSSNENESDTNQQQEQQKQKQLFSQPYWHRGISNSNASRHNSSSNYDDEEYGDDDSDDSDGDRRHDSYNSCSSSIGGKLHDGEYDDDGEDGNSDDDDMISCDERQLQAVLPVIVGGVVRLINAESRDKSHQWTVYIRGLFNETQYLSQCIESVRFILDPSFTPNEHLIKNAPFELTEVGWGEFVVNMQVQLRHYPRPIQVNLSSSSFSSTTASPSEIKMASTLLASQPLVPLSGIARGPILSPVVDVLSRHCYHSSEMNTLPPLPPQQVATREKPITRSTTSFAENKRGVVKIEKREDSNGGNYGGNTYGKDDYNQTDSQLFADNNNNNNNNNPNIVMLGMSPGVVTLSHLLRFSHRPRRPHCIPPLGRPFEPEEHIGYTNVPTPVVTEQYDEIVVPDPPALILEVAEALPHLLRPRIATVKVARAIAQQQQQSSSSQSKSRRHPTTSSNAASLDVASAFSENGVSCWEYIMQEDPDDAVLAEAYLESVAGTLSSWSAARRRRQQQLLLLQQQQQQQGMDASSSSFPMDSPAPPKPGRGRRKLAGAEIDLAALRAAMKGLDEAVEKIRRELVLRQALLIYHQYA